MPVPLSAESIRWPTLRCNINKVSDIDQTGFFLAQSQR
ncbi:hypothetical protein D1AOALGA4SA_7254 [Olavius algarvensis Delta 1 endosymbiont]|nr:hypothetical protein D1AOALGA4SA_7254 [Olavius algarvensis Delta 1 endosymbiont]